MKRLEKAANNLEHPFTSGFKRAGLLEVGSVR
jgi:hypothetical protein